VGALVFSDLKLGSKRDFWKEARLHVEYAMIISKVGKYFFLTLTEL